MEEGEVDVDDGDKKPAAIEPPGDGKADQEGKKGDNEEEPDESQLSEHEKLKRKQKELAEQLESYKETKKEMVWLLKQVINAENKRKASSEASPTKKKAIRHSTV